VIGLLGIAEYINIILKERNNFGYLGIDGSVTLKWRA
jgi:hypothetical protein